MDYLRSFVIGSSGLIVFQHFASITLQKEGVFTIPYKKYVLAAPIYYGLMNVLSLYIGKLFNLSLAERLFLISIISIIFIVSLNYFYSRKRYKPYSVYDKNAWLDYILRIAARHMISFNLIMYYFEKYFSKSYPLKVFIIGSSAFSYLITYYKVGLLDDLNKINYDYNVFTVGEPFGHGLIFVFGAIILKNILNTSVNNAIFINSILIPILWYILASYVVKAYRYNNEELLTAFTRVLITMLIIQNLVLGNLLKYLK